MRAMVLSMVLCVASTAHAAAPLPLDQQHMSCEDLDAIRVRLVGSPLGLLVFGLVYGAAWNAKHCCIRDNQCVRRPGDSIYVIGTGTCDALHKRCAWTCGGLGDRGCAQGELCQGGYCQPVFCYNDQTEMFCRRDAGIGWR